MARNDVVNADGSINWDEVGKVTENAVQLAQNTQRIKNAWVDVKQDFGAKGDGVTDDSTAFVNAISSLPNGGIIFIPMGTYLLNSAFPSLSNIIFMGVGKNKSILKRGFTGDLFPSFGGYSGLEKLTIDGNTATNGSGKGVIMPASSPNSYMFMAEIKNFSDHCLEFGANAGAEFRAISCDFYTTASPGTLGAIAVNGTDSGATSRHFTNCESSGCTLYDFGGCNDFYVTGGYTNGLIFSSNSVKTYISNIRVGSAGGTVTINGQEHKISNCVFAVAVVINATATTFNCEVPNYNITDNGSNNNITILNQSYPVSWTAATTAPSLGNGTLNGYFSRYGNKITAQIELYCGSTTTFGSGSMYFSLPRIDYQYGLVRTGHCEIMADSFYNASARVIQNGGKVSVRMKNAAGTIGDLSSSLVTFASGSTVRITIDYITV